MAPRITSFAPANGVIGTSVTINGANFTGTTAVTFNGTAATTVTVNTAIKITATVPAGATTGQDRRDDSGGHGHQRGELHRQARDHQLHSGQRRRSAPS